MISSTSSSAFSTSMILMATSWPVRRSMLLGHQHQISTTTACRTYPLYTFPKLPPPAHGQHGPVFACPAHVPTYTLLLGVQRRGVHGAAYGKPLGHGDLLLSGVLPRQRPSGVVYICALEVGDSRVRFARVERVSRCVAGQAKPQREAVQRTRRVRTAWTGYATGEKQCARVLSRWSRPGEAVGAS